MSAAQDWWLAAEGRVFGPYESAQLAGFLQEGRLAASSRMGRSRRGPFAPAGDWPELTALFRPPRPEPAQAGPATERALLVVAALRDTPVETLQAALLTFGPTVRVRGTFWACRARLPAAGLRNALSRRLRPDEFLFVAETDGPGAAWFNLDAEVDRALRRLWSEAGQPRRAPRSHEAGR